MRKTYTINSVLSGVDDFGSLGFGAVVQNDLMIIGRRYQVVAGGREVKLVDLAFVVAKHFGQLKFALHVSLHVQHVHGQINNEVGTRIGYTYLTAANI